MPEITITICNGLNETSILRASSDMPLSAVTASVQSALDKCSTLIARRKAWAKNICEDVVKTWNLDLLGKWGAVDGTILFFPTAKIDAHDLFSVSELIEDTYSQIQMGDYVLEAWSEMNDFVKALTLAALIACFEKVNLTVHDPLDFEIGDDKYCPAPGVVRDLWKEMKGYAK
jgi:hypothetical protein